MGQAIPQAIQEVGDQLKEGELLEESGMVHQVRRKRYIHDNNACYQLSTVSKSTYEVCW